jgi:diguanylate cyclase (GGDEF)-like protein
MINYLDDSEIKAIQNVYIKLRALGDRQRNAIKDFDHRFTGLAFHQKMIYKLKKELERLLYLVNHKTKNKNSKSPQSLNNLNKNINESLTKIEKMSDNFLKLYYNYFTNIVNLSDINIEKRSIYEEKIILDEDLNNLFYDENEIINITNELIQGKKDTKYQRILNSIYKKIKNSMKSEQISDSIEVHLEVLIKNQELILNKLQKELEKEKSLILLCKDIRKLLDSNSFITELEKVIHYIEYDFEKEIFNLINEEKKTIYEPFIKFIKVKNSLERKTKNIEKTISKSHKISRKIIEKDLAYLDSSDSLKYISTLKKLFLENPSYFEKAIISKGIENDKSSIYINTLEMFIQQKIKRETKKSDSLKRTYNIDQLTGIHNRKELDKILDSKIRRIIIDLSKKIDNTFSLIMIDLDNFKGFNDTYGHQIGDEVLVYFVNLTSNFLRQGKSDLFFRYGGEEFIILIEADAKLSKNRIEELRNKIQNESSLFMQKINTKTKTDSIEKSKIEMNNNGIDNPKYGIRKNITISLGICDLKNDILKKQNNATEISNLSKEYIEQIKSKLINNADQALYVAKNSGRNKTVLFSEI